ncbi:putative transporter svop-1 [Anticarsia gemmatalis]|uniref:putative transporter svop-1 n=1 Tax=Anticarsia gemmatalis TaxID=129554 RepID=UPI003F75C822
MVKKSFDIDNAACFKENVDIEEAIDEAGHARYNLVLLVTCCVINIGAVMDMLGYSLVVPAASCDLNLTLEQSGILTSISFAGFLFALPWGYVADTTGRRRAILVSAAVGFVLSAITSFSTNFYMMLILKFIASSFSTASMTLTITYLGECTCKRHRSRYLFIQNVSCLGADFVCFVMAYLFLPLEFAIPVPLLTTYKSWRLFTLVMTLPLGIGALMMMYLHESPKFLANKGDTEEAMEVLRLTYKANNGKNAGEYPVKSLMKTDREEATSFWESVVKQTVPIFKPPLLWRTLQLFLLFSICCSTNNVFFMWFPTMVNSFFTSVNEDTSFCQKIVANITPVKHDDVCTENSSMNTIYSGMIFTLFFTVLNIGVIAFANWRRTLTIGSFLISGISCIVVDWVYDSIGSMVLFIMIQFTGLCFGSVEAYYVDIFPTSYRGLATSLGMMLARLSCLGGVSLVGANIIDNCRLTFYCWAVFVFSGIVAAVFLPGDTTKKEKSAEES